MRQLVIWFSIFPWMFSNADYLGCYKDGSPRDLLQRLHHNNVTVSNCVSGCREQEYEYAAVQFAYLCFCGDHYGRFGKLPDEMCDSTCKSPGDQYCGGDWKNSVYATGYKGKKKKHKKRDQVVLFEGPEEIKTSEFAEETEQKDVTGSEKSEVTSVHLRSEVPNSFDAPHVHINPTVYNEENMPGSPGESISAFPLATSSPPLEQNRQPPLEQSAGQTMTTHPSEGTPQGHTTHPLEGTPQGHTTYPLEGTPQGHTTYPLEGTPQGHTTYPLEGTPQGHTTHPGTFPQTVQTIPGQPTKEQSTVPGQVTPEHNVHVENIPTQTASQQSIPEKGTHVLSTEVEYPSISPTPSEHSKSGENIVTLPALETSMNNIKTGTVLIKLPSKYLHLDNKGTKINPKVVNGTVIKINGTLYLVKGTLTKLPKTKSAHANKLIGSLLAGVAPKNSNAHLVNGTKFGITTDGEMFSYEGTASTTLEDKPFNAHVIKVNVKTKDQKNSMKKLPEEKSVSVESKTPISSTENLGKPGANSKDQETSSLSFLSTTPPPPPPPHSYYPPKPLQVPPTSTEEPPLTINKAIAAEAVGFHDTTSQDEQKKTACHIEREMAVSMDDSFMPVCQDDGSYAPVQCFEHKGFGKQCWCVDDQGEEIGDTRTTDGSTPTCEEAPKKHISSEVKYLKMKTAPASKKPGKGSRKYKVETHAKAKLSQCEAEKKISKNQKDMFSPECQPDGSYNPVQCFAHAHYGTRCWCVDDNGREISGSSVQDGDKPDCKKVLSKFLSSFDGRCGQYDCCSDGKTPSPDPAKNGCPEKFLKKPTNTGKKVAHPHNKTTNQRHMKVSCFEVVCGCCPDGVRIAMGPNSQGCGVKRPLVPKAKDICASLVLRQVWFNGLSNSTDPNYQRLASSMKKAITKIYSVKNMFGRMDINGFKPGCYPYDPKRVSSIIVYFTLHFRKTVDHPLKPLQDYLDQNKTLNGKDVFPDSLMLTGIPENSKGCQPTKTSQSKQPQPPPPKPRPTLPSPPVPTKSPLRPPPSPQPPKPAPPAIPAPPTRRPSPSALPKPPAPSPTKPTDLSPTATSPPNPPETHLTPPPTSLPPTIPSSSSSPAPLPEWDYLALYYTFDNHKFPFITDVSRHSNRGQMSAGVNVVGVENGCGLAGSFIGGSITIDGGRFHPKPSQAVTVGLWVKFSATEGEQTLFTTSRQGSYESNYYLASKSGKITWRHKNEQSEKIFEITTSESVVSAGQWAHVAATYDSSKGEAVVFVNSKEIKRVKGKGKLTQDWAGRTEIGSCNGHYPFTGLLDDFVIYSIALDLKAISKLSCTCSMKSGSGAESEVTEQCHRGPKPSTPPPTKATSKVPTILPPPTEAPPTKAPPSTPAPLPAPPSTPAPALPSGPINGGYTDWSEWTKCTSTCGSGMQDRIRNCTNPVPDEGGRDCSGLGPDSETRTCNKQPCPVDGGFTNWSPFSQCTKTCGGGSQVRSRDCANPKPQFGGKTCDHLGADDESRKCNTFFCPVNGDYSEWSDWERCSHSCGGGKQFRSRTCTNPEAQYGGMNCDSKGPPREERICNTNLCPVDGGYSPFGNWSVCSATCGGGNMTRTRSCNNPVPAMGGKDCSQFGAPVEVMKCNEQQCPIDGGFTPFGEWSECSATCGGGVQSRMRACTNPTPKFMGKDCEGVLVETKMCNVQLCPVDTGDGFGKWSECSASCGRGVRSRSSVCGNNPSCQPKTETESCNVQPCPAPGGYTSWGNWGECSTSCGTGIQQRTRSCTNPKPLHGGMGCEVLGPSLEIKNCTLKECPVNGGYSDWSYWTPCTVTCGGGISSRFRNCTSPSPAFGGKDCAELGAETETSSCAPDRCPVMGGYSEWGDWTNCTAKCGGGEQVRSRTCTNPVPEFGGNDCTLIGESLEKRECNKIPCPVPGGYTLWSNWTECSSTCNEGVQYRERQCTNPSPQHGGKDCLTIGPATDKRSCFIAKCPEFRNESEYTEWSECTKTCGMGIQSRASKNGEQTQSRFCNTDQCPVDGGYSLWSEWTDCSATCGGGVTTRRRSCTFPEPQFGGKDCLSAIGPGTETKTCKTEKCPVPKVPVRSCLEYKRRCHVNVDGVYTIFNKDGGETRAYCDMTKDGGGWTLLVTSRSKAGWNDRTVLLRNEEEPSITEDYSILKYADGIKSISTGGFEFRLESSERGSNGGIWKAPQGYSFTKKDSSQVKVLDVAKFGSWKYGKESLNQRMPWLSSSGSSLLTTSDGKTEFGSIISKNPNAPSWIKETDPNPTVVWYWMREAPGPVYEKDPTKKDKMCPKPVDGGYTEWSLWSSCTKTCGGGSQIRTRNCTSPLPIDGGLDCADLGIGGDEESKQCNAMVCPGQIVDGGYSDWSLWSACTVTCGGGSRMRNRKCNNPAPANEGKTCFDQQLGSEMESEACNIEPCEGQCRPKCQNGGQCVGKQCQCTEMYEGKSCEKAICKKACMNQGTCIDPFKNICRCRKGFCGLLCEKSGQACQLYVFYFRITNLAKKNVVFTSSDGIPEKGSLIGSRRIVEIKKKTLSNAPVTFQVKRGNNLLLLNTKPGITIIPGKIVKQPLSLTITESLPQKLYFTNLRVTNLAKTNILLKASDNVPSKGFNIKSNVIAEITKKTRNPKEVLFQAFDASTSKALWVNGRQSFSVKPTETKSLPVSLIIKATVPVVKTYHIVLQVTNLARTDVRLFAKGLEPLTGFLIKNNVIVLIKMATQQSTAVTFTVMDEKTKTPFYINGAASIGVVPKLVPETPEPLTITRSAGDIKATSYYVVIQVINKIPRKIVLIPDDNEPAQGFVLGPKTISLITKTVRAKQPIIFKAIDAESDGELLINKQTNVSLVPTISKDHIESLTITSESGDEDTGQPQIDPYYFWSFLTIINGKIPGHLPFKVNGHVEVVDEGLYFDGTSGFLSARLVSNDILASPDKARQGLAFGIKLKFDGAVKQYDTPRYVLDTGAKSGGKTGVSLYVLNGKLIAEIATTSMRWKTAINVIYDKWLYIIINWRPTSGLVTALNGFPKSTDPKGSPVNGLGPSPRNPNFCLGRNVGGTGFYYTKFYLASLVVFKEYLSDSLIYPVYLYYQINVLVQPSKLYYANLKVINKFTGAVEIKFGDNVPPNGFYLKSNVIAHIKKKTNSPTAITVYAEDPVTKKPLYVNDLPKLRITPSQFEEQVSTIVVSTKSGIDGTSLFRPVGCFNDRRNPRPLPEMLQNFHTSSSDWSSFNNTIMKCALLAKKKNYKYFGLQEFGQCWSGPSGDSSYAKDGKSLQCSYGLGKANALYVYKFSNQAVAPRAMYYLAANIYNKYGKPVILKSSDSQPADQVIPVNGVAQLTKDVPNQTPVMFEAFDASAPTLRLSMNNRRGVSITPSTVKGAPHTVVIKDGGTASGVESFPSPISTSLSGDSTGILTSPWNIWLTIINKVDSNIILFSSDNDPPQGFKIKRGYIVTLSKILSSKQKISFRAIEDPSRAKVLFNDKESFEVTAKQGKPSPVAVTLTAFKGGAIATENNQGAVDVEAPPVTARHSWIFTYILNGKIPGEVPLSVHGKTEAKNGAIMFDGTSSWLGGTLSSTDCLIAPANCRDGLSIGFKIKLTGLSKFPEERYIVDTGVLSKGTRGVAIYLTNGQLCCVIMTMTAQWKLGMTIQSDRWLFIGVSWSENQGLYLYNDGKLVAQTKIKTPQNQVPIGKTSPNFVFGRSLIGTGFGRFLLASFSFFTTFLAESGMKPVFTYYWRIGLSPPTNGKTFIDIKVSNQAGRDIVLMSSDKMPPKGLTIIKGVTLDFVKQFTGAASVTFTAKDVMTGQLIYLNGKESVTLKSSSVKRQKFNIFATTKPGHISTETSQFYFVLKVLNRAGSDIFIKCTDGVPKQGFAVKKGFIVVITKLTNSVTPVGFSANDIHGKAVLLNGKAHLTLTPSTVRGQPMNITVQNVQASGGPRYYIGLKLLNKAGSDVILTSSDHNPKPGFKIKQGLVVLITKTVASLQPVMFTAVDSNGGKVILNNKMNIILKPSPIKGQPFTVTMAPTAGAKTLPVYFTSMKVINKYSKDIVIKSSDNYPKNGYIIKPNNIAIITKKSSSGMPVDYSVYDVQTKKPILVNQHQKVTLKPHMIRGQPVNLLVGGTVTATKKTEVEHPQTSSDTQTTVNKQTSSPIYYLVLKIANRAGFDATIIPDDSQPPQFQIRKGYLEIVTKKSRSKQAVVLKAVKTGTNEALSINGKDDVSLLPTRMKGEPIILNLRTKGDKLRDEKLKPETKSPFYVNLHVSNQSPGETVFFPVKDSPESGFHLNPGTAMNIKETVDSKRPIAYMALRGDNHKPLLLNSQNRLTITPDRSKMLNTEVNITTAQEDSSSLQKDCHVVSCPVPKPPSVPDRFITLILHNKLGRAARVVPSKGQHKNRGYVIKSHSFVKVSIIIKGEKYVEPITFHGEDLETQSKLLLNKALFPISLTPSDAPDAITNISISAEAPHAKPLQSWSLSSYDGTSIPGSPSLSVHGEISAIDDGLHFDGSTSSMDTYIEGSHCLHDTEICTKGFSFGTKLRIDKAANGYTEPKFILDTGGHGDKTRGVSLFVENKKLVAEVTTKNKRYRATTPLVLSQWIYVIMTFKKGLGLSLYYDAQLRSMDNTGSPVPDTHPVETDKNLLIGRNIEGPPYQYAAFDMASLTVFQEYLHEDDVNRVFLFFWSGKSAKIYYATLRIINGAGRPAILKPNRGKDDGFPIKPNSTQQIVLMSMSTDNNPIEPVVFHAIDAETSTKLMINHFIRPFVVVPKESKKDLTTVLVTSPAPSILPKYIWNFKHVDTGVIRDSEPKLMVHGFYEPEEDSLRLLPGDTWIDVGDFKGLCISDPQMCDEGMGIAVKLKFNDEAKNYTDEPRFILDSGAHDSQSRGFSLHYQDGQLHCVTAISNAEWKASAPISFHEWKYVMFTWKKNEGLSLYINGHLKDQMKHSIDKPGLHHTDKFTRFEIARNVAGPPYGHAQFTINSLAFFDEHLSKADALREYIYYWGNAVPAFSNRYIKVRFDNKAGTNVRITPSKGGAKDQGYSIKPHMSLELSFVAKGTSANVPVTFRAQDELSGDSLLINTSEEPFAVSPSDSSTHMTVATVTSSVKCLSPNGLFPDPTNEFGYINCTAGSAKRVPCGMGMKWEDETKSCQLKGGLPTLYYATLQLHNNAGKDIELVESEGKETPHLITKGEMRKIKLIGHETKHYKFEAIDNSTGEPLVLNNQAFASVTLGDDPDRLMDITISKPSHFYTVKTYTGSQPDAGTSANVFVQLIGNQGRSEELPLKHTGAKEFQPGQIDKFRVPALDIGKIIKVKVKQDGSGRSPSWYLNKITVKDDNQHSSEFPLYDWLTGVNSENEPTEKQLVLYHGKRTCVPSCQNGGECVEGKCQCPSSFEGVSCEKALCPVPCKNGGECVNPTSNECRCPQGYQGQYCENAICTSRCLNGGICVAPNRCTCLAAYSGERCEISSCKPDCINGGVCKKGKCECSSGYSGEYCQVEHTCELPLETGPCLHELRQEIKEGKSEERSDSCSKYLTEVLNNCQARGSTYTQNECEKQCDPTLNTVCSRIWNPAKCQTDTKRFRFNAQTRTCDQFMFSGCLGNTNNFGSESTCNQACSTDIKRRKRYRVADIIGRFLRRPL